MAVVQLTTPMLDRAVNPTTLTDSKRLSHWVSELPVANPLGVAQLFNNALSLLNRHPDPMGNHLELMRCYLPTFTNLINTYINIAKQQAPSSQSRKEREQQLLTEKITVEMAYGYKRIINDSQLLVQGNFKPEIQAEIIFHTIECLALSLMFFFSHYREEPRNTFKEILQLYLLAERMNISTMQITSGLQTENPVTIRLIFKRILLLQLLDPSHLPRGEIWLAYDYLGNWATEARITQVPDQIDNFNGRFLLSLSGNEKTIVYSPTAVRENRDNYLLLDTIPLNKVINQHLKSRSGETPGDTPGIPSITDAAAVSLFRHMLLAWHIRPKRRHDRDEKHQWVVTAAGINQINHFLKTQDLVETNSGSASFGNNENNEFEISSMLGGRAASSYKTSRWRQINTSLSGAALVIHPDQQCDLHVGQLIIMGNEDLTGQKGLTVGIVRRMVQKGSNALEAGVQYIQGKLIAVDIRPVVFGADGMADFQAALYLDRGDSQPGTLFTSNLLYHTDREYVMQVDDREDQRVFAKQLLESSRYYDRFEFRLSPSNEE